MALTLGQLELLKSDLVAAVNAARKRLAEGESVMRRAKGELASLATTFEAKLAEVAAIKQAGERSAAVLATVEAIDELLGEKDALIAEADSTLAKLTAQVEPAEPAKP